MFFKKIKKFFVVLFISVLFSIPNLCFAYSDYIIPGGENVGILVNAKGVIVVGMYKVNDDYPGRVAKLEVGDVIVKVNDKKVENISNMVDEIENCEDKENIKIGYIRDDTESSTNLKLVMQSDGVYRTGLYVKDSINGIGTLTFIDPETKYYGALGHEIIESNTNERLDIKDGKIYKSEVTGIDKSERGNPGEKQAKYYPETTFGKILENTESGIFGKYTSDLPSDEKLKVAQPDEVHEGKAVIRTTLDDNEIKEYSINILKVNKDTSNTKNILFEITDEVLIEKTGGVVQGMSGSPIIQDDKIIGAVTHVVVDNTKMGYGIFITTMLEEAEN